MKRYPKYRDSGIDWIGEIPEHWEVKRNKYIFKEINERSETGLETLLMVSQRYGLVERDEFAERPASSESLIGYKICQVNDLILNKLKAYLGVFFRASISGLVSPDYTVFRAIENVEVDYFEHLFKTPLYISELNRESKGIVIGFFRLYTPDFYNLFSVVPPIKEQKQIVNYIRRKSLEIDHFISNKQRLIELLKEQKTAIINRAVTKGLNSHVSMKNSGVEWLGEIPAHWEIIKLKYISSIRYGLGQPPREKVGGLPLIRATNVERGKIVEKDLLFVDPEDVPYSRTPILKEGEIIVVRSGAYTADSAIIPKKFEGAIAGYDMVVKAKKINCKLLSYIFLSNYVLQHQLYVLRMRAAQPHLNSEELGQTFILVPKKEAEQQAIVAYIEKESSKIDQAITKIEKEIELIQEYRTTLISDAVTGKIDVREPSAVEPTLTAAAI